MTETDLLSEWNTRLRGHAARLIDALDGMKPPVTVADITSQSRAISAVKRMVDLVFNVARPRAKATPIKAAPATEAPAPEPAPQPADDLALPPLNRQQRRHAERLMRKEIRSLLAPQSESGSSSGTASAATKTRLSPGTSTT